MKQKLAIARALLHDPAVVFLDEPTAALDPEAAYVVREAIEALRRSGRTIVLATHNLVEADRLCDRVAFVRGGLLRIDSPAGLRGSMAAGRGVDIGLADAASERARRRGALRGGRGWRGSRRPPAGRGRSRPGRDHARTSCGRSSRPAPTSSRSTSTRRTLEEVYFEVMGVAARPGRGRLMRGRIVDRRSCAGNGRRRSATAS